MYKVIEVPPTDGIYQVSFKCNFTTYRTPDKLLEKSQSHFMIVKNGEIKKRFEEYYDFWADSYRNNGKILFCPSMRSIYFTSNYFSAYWGIGDSLEDHCKTLRLEIVWKPLVCRDEVDNLLVKLTDVVEEFKDRPGNIGCRENYETNIKPLV